MAFLRFKRADPIDRAISDLDQQIATVQRQLREASNDPTRAGENRGTSAGTAPQSPAQTFTRFVKDMLVPPGRTASPTYHTREDLFDGGAEPCPKVRLQRGQADEFSVGGLVDVVASQLAGKRHSSARILAEARQDAGHRRHPRNGSVQHGHVQISALYLHSIRGEQVVIPPHVLRREPRTQDALWAAAPGPLLGMSAILEGQSETIIV